MSPELSTRIRSYAAQLESDVEHVTVAELEELVEEQAFGRDRLTVGPLGRTGQIRSRWPRWALAFTAALVLVLAAIGLPLWFFGGSDVVDQTTTTVPTTTVPTTTVPTTVPPLVESWQEVGTDVISPSLALVSASRFGSGFVTVGLQFNEEKMRQNSAVFLSEDGINWNQMAEGTPELSQGAVLMYGVNEGGPGIIAVGMGCESDDPCRPYPTVWTSTDGVEWLRFGADAGGLAENEFGVMFDVLSTQHGIVGVGQLGWITEEDTVLYQPMIWISPDGVDWSRVFEGEAVDPGDIMDAGPSVVAIAEGPDGLVIGVGRTVGIDGETVAAVWASTDGASWERVDPAQPAFEGPSGMYDVAWGSEGFVAVGTVGGVEAAIWISTDGYEWTRLDLSDEPFDSTGTLSSVAALESGYVIGGPHAFEDLRGAWATLWTSVDGRVWDRVHATEPGHAMAILPADAGVVVAGGKWGEEEAGGAVWVGPVLDPTNPAPDPQPPIPDEYEEDTDDGEMGVGALEDGYTCEELAADTYGYEEAVSYWASQGVPDDFDLDADGPPCADAYPEEDVAGVFGSPEQLSVVIDSDVGSRTYTATGPAVDAGVMCAEGTTAYIGGGDGVLDPVALDRWEIEFTCSDGSGTFVLGVDSYIIDAGGFWGPWNIVSGTGKYESLVGGGAAASASIYAQQNDLMIGRLWHETEEG